MSLPAQKRPRRGWPDVAALNGTTRRPMAEPMQYTPSELADAYKSGLIKAYETIASASVVLLILVLLGLAGAAR